MQCQRKPVETVHIIWFTKESRSRIALTRRSHANVCRPRPHLTRPQVPVHKCSSPVHKCRPQMQGDRNRTAVQNLIFKFKCPQTSQNRQVSLGAGAACALALLPTAQRAPAARLLPNPAACTCCPIPGARLARFPWAPFAARRTHTRVLAGPMHWCHRRLILMSARPVVLSATVHVCLSLRMLCMQGAALLDSCMPRISNNALST